MFQKIAHRGACLELQEDTLAALVRASACGADVVECDPRPTKDGQLVIFHDEDLFRLAGDSARVADLTLDELRTKLATVGLTVNTLREILDGYRGSAAVLFDLYDDANDPALYRALAAAPFRAIAGIHTPENVRAARQALPPEDILAFLPAPERYREFAGAGCGILRLWQPWLETVTPAEVKAACPGCKVWIMACDPQITHPLHCMDGSEEALRRAAALGADGMLLNDIRMAVRVVL